MDQFFMLAGIAGVFLMVCASPGPSFVVISSTAIAVHRPAAILVGLGVAAATFTWAAAAALGLGLLLAKLAWLYAAIRLAGAAYLIYLGVRMSLSARRSPSVMEEAGVPPTTSLRFFGKGYLIAVSNPMAAIFFGSVFSAMLPSTTQAWIYACAVGTVTAVSACWHCGIAIVFSFPHIRAVYRRLKRGIDALAGTALILLGVRPAASR